MSLVNGGCNRDGCAPVSSIYALTRVVLTHGVKIKFTPMNSQAFKTLEFDSLRALVRRNAQTETGRTRIDSLAPSDDYARLSTELRAVGEMIELRQRGA